MALYSIEPCFHQQSHAQLVVFLLWLHPFIFSRVISPLISSSILGTYRSGEFIYQCLIFFSFHTVHGVLEARILKWFAIPFSSDHILSDFSSMTQPSAWLSFIELDKAVFRVIRLARCLWLGFPSVCPLIPSQCLPSYLCLSCLGWWCLFMAAPAKGSRCSLPVMRGYKISDYMYTDEISWLCDISKLYYLPFIVGLLIYAVKYMPSNKCIFYMLFSGSFS